MLSAVDRMWSELDASMHGVPDELNEVIAEVERRFGKVDIDEERVRVICPKCNKTGHVLACKDIVLSSNRGVYDYPVKPGTICEHGFMVQIDANMKAR